MNRIVPYTTRVLLLSCYTPADRRFKQIYNISRILDRVEGYFHLLWNNKTLDLREYKLLDSIIISGHGSARVPRISNRRRIRLTADQLLLPPGVKLYFLPSYQGRDYIRREWIRSLGIAPENFFGSVDTVAVIMSILFFLHLLDNPRRNITSLFQQWNEINDRYRKIFPELIRTYKQENLNYDRTFEILEPRYHLQESYPYFFKVQDKFFGFLDGVR